MDIGSYEELVQENYPVARIKAYGKGCFEVVREAKQKSQQPLTERGVINMLTRKALVRLMFTVHCTEIEFRSMFTATYPKIYPRDGTVVKDDINAMANKFRRMGFTYLWFLEFQERGAPHVHWLLDNATISPRLRIDIGLYWTQRIVLSDWFCQRVTSLEEYQKETMKIARFNTHPETFSLIRERDGARNYVVKYASKEKQKEVPKDYSQVGRFWGASQSVKPDAVTLDCSEADLEEWLTRNDHPASKYTLVPKYIWGIGTLHTEESAKVEG